MQDRKKRKRIEGKEGEEEKRGKPTNAERLTERESDEYRKDKGNARWQEQERREGAVTG